MQACIIYSSQTGNTKKVAEALANSFGFPLYRVQELQTLPVCELYVLGFWVRKAMPDVSMQRCMEELKQKRVFYFCTHAAWPNSPHMKTCQDNVTNLLSKNGNVIVGSFTCQGRISEAVFKHPHHPMTPERRARLLVAASHPNQEDLDSAILALQRCLYMRRT